MTRTSALPAVTLALLFPLVAAAATADSDRITEGSLRAVSSDGRALPLPLKHTDVQAEVSGFVTRVQVVQTFQNPFNERIEAIYVFPLPDKGAVDGMTMKIGERLIKGEIKRREEARQLYEAARNQGRTAALLDQERPNIFTQSVANILPREEIQVTLTFVAPLEYDHGRYTFNFPMVVGPRYIPGTPLSGQSQGSGVSRDTDRVPDASRISPPLLAEGQRSGHDISVKVKLDAGVAIQKLESPSHDVEIIRSGTRQAEITLKPHDSVPNKDFILRYDVAGEQLQAGILTHKDERGGFFTLMLQPQADFRASQITAKEMFFVIDQSCSQSGLPMAKQKAIIHEALDKMNPADTFNIVTFNSGVSFFAPKSLLNRPENVQRAKAFVDRIDANGGTEMLQGVLACLNAPRDPERLRMLLFLSDGYVGNDTEIISAVEKNIGNARMFTYGVGNSVNHFLLDRMAEVGRGYYQYARVDEDTGKSVRTFYDRIAKPYLVDIELDFGDLGVREVYPKKIRDLFASQPIIVTGRYEGGGKGRFTLKGRIANQAHVEQIEVDLPKAAQPQNEALASMFGRARIEHLTAQQYGGEKPEVVKQITETALAYRLMSPYTSFIAVDEARRAADGAPAQVVQPVAVPEGTNAQAFGAPPPQSPAVFGNASGGSMGYGRGAGPGGKGGGGMATAQPAPSRTRSPGRPLSKSMPMEDRLDAKELERSERQGDADDAGGAELKPAPEKARGLTLQLHDVVIRGPLSRADAQRHVNLVLQQVRAKLGSSTATGELTVRLTIDATGAVTEVKVVHDGLDSKQVSQAIRDALKASALPKLSGETVLTIRISAR